MSCIRRAAVLVTISLGLFAAQALTASPQDTVGALQVDEVRIDRAKIRFGDIHRFDPAKNHRVGTVASSRFYEATDPVKTIRREHVEKGSARYKQLMKEATTIFKRCLEQVARENSLVLIVEAGGIEGYPSSDVTSLLIQKV